MLLRCRQAYHLLHRLQPCSRPILTDILPQPYLAGDCDFKMELLRGNVALRGQFQKCVRRRAELSGEALSSSVAATPRCCLQLPMLTLVLKQLVTLVTFEGPLAAPAAVCQCTPVALLLLC